MEVAKCPAAGHDLEKTICPAARKITKNLAAVNKTVLLNETVLNRCTYCGKERLHIKLSKHYTKQNKNDFFLLSF